MLLGTFKTTKLRYLLTLFSLLCLLVLPHDAYAADQGYGSFWYGPNEKTVEGVKYYKTGVVASNKYDAALYALGFSKSTVNGISNSKKNTLMSNSTFSSFANRFKTGKPDDDAIALIPGVPTVGLYADNMLTTWYAASAMYGSSNCYWSVYSKSAADSAEDAAYKIIKSGSESGGSGGSDNDFSSGDASSDGDYTLLPVSEYAPDAPYECDYVAIQTSTYDRLLNYASGHHLYLFVRLGFDAGASSTAILVRPLKVGSFVETPYNGKKWGTTYNESYDTVEIFDPTVQFQTIGGYKCAVSDDTNVRNVHVGAGVLDGVRPLYYCGWIGVPPSGGGDDPTEWPTEPTEPIVPPDPPGPVEPDPPTPWNPIPGIDIDVTGDDFQDLLDALNEHCIHLQNSINSNVSQLWQLQSELFTNQLGTFWDNLHNDLLWLGECLNFDVNVNVDAGGGDTGGGEDSGEGDTNTFVPFDDSSVIYWLKQIWSKLGNGISVRPVDPVVNPTGWWDWFGGLLSGLIGALADIGLDKIGGLVDALDTLKDKFPFCIPWDIAALLGLLVSEPVTPVVQVPLMALSVSNGVQQVGSMVIDLEPYNDAWEAVRWIERIAFCVYLATRTKDFLDLLGKIKG